MCFLLCSRTPQPRGNRATATAAMEYWYANCFTAYAQSHFPVGLIYIFLREFKHWRWNVQFAQWVIYPHTSSLLINSIGTYIYKGISERKKFISIIDHLVLLYYTTRIYGIEQFLCSNCLMEIKCVFTDVSPPLSSLRKSFWKIIPRCSGSIVWMKTPQKHLNHETCKHEVYEHLAWCLNYYL